MLHSLVRGINIVAKTRGIPGSLLAATEAQARSADQNTALGCARGNGTADLLREIRIIHRIGRIGTDIEDLMPLVPEIIGKRPLQVKAGVVGPNREFHSESPTVEQYPT